MTRKLKLTTVAIATTLMLSSCFSSRQIVGKGAQGNSYATAKNHNMFFGTVKDESCNTEEMAGNAENYTISTKQTFADVVLAVVTLGVYTPTKTTVIR